MKILWVKADYLHPTTRGGQIRTLSILRQLHQQHEVHYVALDHDEDSREGPSRAAEYCSYNYPVPHRAPAHSSVQFGLQLARGVISSVPVAVARWGSALQRQQVETLLAREQFDSLVCDFLFPALNIPDLSKAVLFQHNVESTIWRRRTEHAGDPLRRWYLQRQAQRMEAFEGGVCRRAGHIIAVSANDAQIMRGEFGATRVSEIPTGVDLESLAPPGEPVPPVADLVFVGSLDWAPNVDGLEWFVETVLPHIRATYPGVKVAIVGRNPPASVRARGACR